MGIVPIILLIAALICVGIQIMADNRRPERRSNDRNGSDHILLDHIWLWFAGAFVLSAIVCSVS